MLDVIDYRLFQIQQCFLKFLFEEGCLTFLSAAPFLQELAVCLAINVSGRLPPILCLPHIRRSYSTIPLPMVKSYFSSQTTS